LSDWHAKARSIADLGMLASGGELGDLGSLSDAGDAAAVAADANDAGKAASAVESAANSAPMEYTNLYGAESGGVLAQVDSSGVLNLAIEKGLGTPSGSAMFDDAMKAVGPNVKAIRGTWNTGMPDNLNSFNEAIKSGMSPEAAARATFTGKMAGRYRFTGVTVEKLIGSPGDYTNVKVVFTK